MRETWARRIALLTGLLVLLLAAAFAILQNPTATSDTTANMESPEQAPPEPPLLDPESIAAGRLVYELQTCARCHSVAGRGNRRNPLDGVGARRRAEDLRDWITGAEALRAALPARAFKMKQAYAELPGDDLEALVVYMRSLRTELNGARE